MKISKRELRQIIREEVANLNEQAKDEEAMTPEEAAELEGQTQDLLANIDPEVLSKIGDALGAKVLPSALKQAKSAVKPIQVNKLAADSYLTTEKQDQVVMLADSINQTLEAAFLLVSAVEGGEQMVDFNKSAKIDEARKHLRVALDYADFIISSR
jgi:hypothetical protein